MKKSGSHIISQARLERRKAAADIAMSLIGVKADPDFDPVNSPLCAIDVVMIAGAPWLREALERDFSKDESGYRKIGGGANTPERPYFFRSTANLIHYLKRQNLYLPRGSREPTIGMACFFDHEERGRFNFIPDRSGIITEVHNEHVREVVMAPNGNEVQRVSLILGSQIEQALIGYSDLP